jgi:hypothetical protein
LPAELHILTAYHIRNKNSLTHYDVQDFDLSETKAFTVETLGCQLTVRDENQLVIRIESPEFCFDITGFDTNRDLDCFPKLRYPNAPLSDDAIDLDSEESNAESTPNQPILAAGDA